MKHRMCARENSESFEQLLVNFVNMYANVPDLHLNPRLYPKLWFMPMDTDEAKREAAHYFLLAVSLTETKVVGNTRNVRVILNHLHRALGECLYRIEDPSRFEEEVKNCESKCRLFGQFGQQKDEIPRVLASVNKFVNDNAEGDLIKYSQDMASLGKKPEDMVEELGKTGARLGGRHKGKAWLYMRLMVGDRPDLRLFKSFSPRDLLIPLTAATLRVAIALGLADKSIAEVLYSDKFWKDYRLIRNIQAKVTEYAKGLFPDDPAKVDFPFFVLGRWLSGLDLNGEVLIRSLKFFDRKYKEVGKPPIEYLVQIQRNAQEIGASGSLERFVAEGLVKRKIPFEYEPLEFRLSSIPGEPPTFKPDFILDIKIRGKKVILEPHGNWDNERNVIGFIRKLSLFKKNYGEYFVLILIVPNERFYHIRQKIPPEMEAYDRLWSKHDLQREFDRLLRGGYS